jgi:hypothetical protein
LDFIVGYFSWKKKLKDENKIHTTITPSTNNIGTSSISDFESKLALKNKFLSYNFSIK